MKTAVIGSGNMGTALACLLADNGHSVICWDHIPEVVEEIKTRHQNSRFLPGVALPGSVTADHLLQHVVKDAPLIFIAVPSVYFRQVVKAFSPFSMAQAVVVGFAKGLEISTGKQMSEVYAEAAVHSGEQYVACSGPSIANEFSKKKPTAVILACANSHALQKAEGALANPYFHVETSDDIAGVELGGVLKNIYALGLGLLDGLNLGTANLKAAFTTIALKEMKQIAGKFGADEKTLDGLPGLGDLVATGFAQDSHNRKMGEFLASGMEPDKALAQLGGEIPEGFRALPAVLEKIGDTLEAPLAKLIQTALRQPASRVKFIDEIWRIF
jgi:glycerol-3-phosphate dehydrogenase (NAD(P)+)